MSIFTISLVIAAIHLAVPIILPLLGGLISERSGVMNIGLEGMMLGGALTAVVFSFLIGNAWLGLLAAGVSGVVSGGLLAFLTVTLRGNQVVASTAINLVGAGLTAALVPIIWGVDGISPGVAKIPSIEIPGLSALPVVGPLFGELSLVDYGTIVLVVGVWWVLFHTDLGLRVRACGESAEAADSAGIDVVRTRLFAVTFSGVFAALGGAYLSIVVLDAFQANMTQGRGYLALAALVFGKWRVWPGVAACVVFGFAEAIALRSQIVAPDIPHELLQAMPYVLALIALATFVGRGTAPAAVGKEFARA
ncbi:ABC transporter permease [Microbacterium thalassium]|uniref:Simple sugar transport system permease protein n=1 Tax=Microbacterium thalassium TaxID=362649 RepID=A0A7X0FP54_9MICO|nr:ABC transporter permease [Microbacterium thalassium]MBB6390547.1 simple sugar transport system permease protein [Microbacterium thalassium]GLK25658.1 ABC transporter permease [Microbacterium thalassium]